MLLQIIGLVGHSQLHETKSLKTVRRFLPSEQIRPSVVKLSISELEPSK